MSGQRAYWDGLWKDRSPGESCPSIIQGEVARDAVPSFIVHGANLARPTG
jgi:hypothetical protein